MWVDQASGQTDRQSDWRIICIYCCGFGKFAKQHKGSLRSDISVSPCVVSTNLLYSGIICDSSGCDLQIAFFFTFRYLGPPPNATTPRQPHRKQRLHLTPSPTSHQPPSYSLASIAPPAIFLHPQTIASPSFFFFLTPIIPEKSSGISLQAFRRGKG